MSVACDLQIHIDAVGMVGSGEHGRSADLRSATYTDFEHALAGDVDG